MSMSASNSSSFCEMADDDAVVDLLDVTLMGILVLDEVNKLLLLVVVVSARDDERCLVLLELLVVEDGFVVPVFAVEAVALSCFLNCCDMIRSKSVAGLLLRSLEFLALPPLPAAVGDDD